VRNVSLFVARRPRRDDAQSRYTAWIGVDDDAAGFLRELKRQRRLAVAVGPAISTAVLPAPCEFTSWSLVATLICNPADRAR